MELDEREFVLLESVNTLEEAELIAGFLGSYGVPCQPESLLFRQEPVSTGLLGRVRLHVQRCDLERARRLLAEQRAESGESNDVPDIDESLSS